jgi:hypothetical protein
MREIGDQQWGRRWHRWNDARIKVRACKLPQVAQRGRQDAARDNVAKLLRRAGLAEARLSFHVYW